MLMYIYFALMTDVLEMDHLRRDKLWSCCAVASRNTNKHFRAGTHKDLQLKGSFLPPS